MRLLLDTHIWIWSRLDPDRLVPQVATELQNPIHELWLSPLSIWELMALTERGRVSLDIDIRQWVAQALADPPIREAMVTNDVTLETLRFRLQHRDPFDWLLVATARVYELTLITSDERLIGIPGVPVLPNR